IKYKAVKMKYHNPLTTLCGVASCVILACATIVGIKFTKPIENIPYEFANTVEEKTSDGAKIYIKYFKVDNKPEAILKKLVEKSEFAFIISNPIINEVTYSYKNNRFLLMSSGNSNINKVIFGNKSIEKNKIEFLKYFGMTSLEKLEKSEDVDWKKWEMEYIGHEIPESEKSTTYFKQVPTVGYDLKNEKQYLVFMNYNKDNGIYEVSDSVFGIMEYDPNTNMVKNVETGEFEEFDWSLIENKK
ncbi:MAG: hypothetical protein J6C46_12380, partial [Clostridia bacterium]|nr:hypothetical protein [Clostridia bacterium]